MPKSEIHPKWYPDAKVICNGEVVMTTGSTKPELHVDVWSGNHPFFTGTQKILDTEGRVDRFMKKYGMGSADSATSKETKESVVIQITALRREIDIMSKKLKPLGLVSTSRTGAIAMTRGAEVFK